MDLGQFYPLNKVDPRNSTALSIADHFALQIAKHTQTVHIHKLSSYIFINICITFTVLVSKYSNSHKKLSTPFISAWTQPLLEQFSAKTVDFFLVTLHCASTCTELCKDFSILYYLRNEQTKNLHLVIKRILSIWTTLNI